MMEEVKGYNYKAINIHISIDNLLLVFFEFGINYSENSKLF